VTCPSLESNVGPLCWHMRKLLVICLFSVARLPAQFEYGEILGTIRDASGAVITKAKVTLRNVETNVERAEISNGQGAYSFPGLRTGQHVVQLQTWDTTFSKNFAVSQQRHFQFRGDLFNLFNHVNYNPHAMARPA
jgi:hypothetical protein